jgi:large subunit ribosomal protein L3
MISGYICKKSKMFAIFTPEGVRISVTKLIANPLTVVDVKDNIVKIAYGKKKNINSSVAGFLKKNKLEIKPQHFKQFTLKSESIPELGAIITPDLVFAPGDTIHATGKSKGRGFAGVIKRHGFKKQPIKNSSDRVRAPGSIGAQTPSKVVKGKKMPGHYGNKTKTILNLKIVSINKDTSEILVAGSVPGAINSWVTLNKAL